MAAIDLSRAVPPKTPSLPQLCLSRDEVMLGPIQPADLGALFGWLNDVSAAGLDLPYRPVDCVLFCEWLDRLTKDQSQILFAIRKQGVAEILGFVLFKNFQPVHQSAELGVRIGADSDRGKGLGTKAVGLALDYAWATLNLHRVSLNVLAHNHRAIACYKSAGMVQEGHLRESAFINGRWCDVVLMSALNPHRR